MQTDGQVEFPFRVIMTSASPCNLLVTHFLGQDHDGVVEIHGHPFAQEIRYSL